MPAIHHYRTLTSTNDTAKTFIKKNILNAVIVADTQTKGRGRFSRRWHSAKAGLWFSIIEPLQSDTEIQKLHLLTFCAAIAVRKSIERITGISPAIKWPNDIMYRNKKLCGILTESILGDKNAAIIGIGININQPEFPDEIKQTATSLFLITGKRWSAEKLLHSALSEFQKYLSYFHKNNRAPIVAEWKKHCDTIGKKITVATINKKITGTAIGIDASGALIVRTKKNRRIKIIEGLIKDY